MKHLKVNCGYAQTIPNGQNCMRVHMEDVTMMDFNLKDYLNSGLIKLDDVIEEILSDEKKRLRLYNIIEEEDYIGCANNQKIYNILDCMDSAMVERYIRDKKLKELQK